jgi:TDG/mug DNA glycosylase family protein
MFENRTNSRPASRGRLRCSAFANSAAAHRAIAVHLRGMMVDRGRPTPEELEAARGGRVRDVIAPDLRVLFVGINPSLYSVAVGHHFARPGNRFWPSLYRCGLTPRVLSPFEDRTLLEHGAGLTNLVHRATARADEVSADELVRGGRALRAKVRRYRPKVVAIVGVTAYRIAFGMPRAAIGRQPEALADAIVWALPNPSGLNAHYQIPALAKLDRRATP